MNVAQMNDKNHFFVKTALFFILISAMGMIPAQSLMAKYVPVLVFGSKSSSGNGQLDHSQDVAVDSFGNVFIADSYNCRVQKFDKSGNYVTQFGSCGSGNEQLGIFFYITVDSYDNVYVVNTNSHRIQKFDNNGNYQSQFGSYGNGDGQFITPNSATIDSSGNIFVLDTGNNRVQKFDQNGNYLTQFGNGQFSYPFDIAVDHSGNIFVADTMNYRIQKFDNNGNYLSYFGGYGQFNQTKSVTIDNYGNVFVVDSSNTGNNRISEFDNKGNYIRQFGNFNTAQFAITGIAVDITGNIFIADYINNRVQQYNSAGVYQKQFGSYVAGNGQFNFPHNVVMDSSGNIFVADSGNDRIQKFDKNGNYISQFGSSGTANGQFDFPKGIAIDSSGNIFIADTYNNRIQKFSNTGVYQSQFGSRGAGNGQVDQPESVYVDSYSKIFVVDTNNHRIQKFDSNGNYLSQFGSQGSGNGQFDFPEGIVIDSAGNIFISDLYNHRIQKFSSSGNYQNQFGSSGTDNGQFNGISGMAIDGTGNIFVADSGNNRIQKFDNNGNYLSQFGSYATDSGQFNHPTGIAIDSSGNIFVVDTDNHRIQKWAWKNSFTVAFQAGKGGTISAAINPQSVDEGSNAIPVTAVPYTGFTFVNWTGTGGFVISNTNPLSVTNVTSDMTITANFQLNSISLTSIAPNSGPTSGGTTVTITGTNFAAGATVTFGGTAATITSVSATQITCITPAHAAGVLDVVVTVGEVPETLTSGFTYTSVPSASLSLSSPLFSENGGSTTVTASLDRTNASITTVNLSFGGTAVFGNDYTASASNITIPIGQLSGSITLAGISDTLTEGDETVSVSIGGGVMLGDTTAVTATINDGQPPQPEQPTNSRLSKAIIVAGGGPYEGNTLWNATKMNADYAYKALIRQGYTKDTVYYLSPVSDDLDGNGKFDDADAGATNSNFEYAIKTWTSDAGELFIYMVDHGGDGTFRMNKNETLRAETLDQWLDYFQNSNPVRIVLVYDACRSGSFLPLLKPSAGKERILAASTSSDTEAVFASDGKGSYSFIFWAGFDNGESFYDSLTGAKKTVGLIYPKQVSQIDANGNGIPKEKEDMALAENVRIGNEMKFADDIPAIGSVSPEQMLNNRTSATIYAKDIVGTADIGRVWAVITPPDYSPATKDIPVTNLPTIDLLPAGNGRYEAVYNGFGTVGTYNIAVFAMDKSGGVSLPVQTSVFRNSCIPVGNDLALHLCAEYLGEKYGFTMNYTPNPKDTSGLYWKMNIATFGSLSADTGNCLIVNEDLDMNLCGEYQGHNYAFTMNFYLNPYDISGLYWKMDLSTFREVQ